MNLWLWRCVHLPQFHDPGDTSHLSGDGRSNSWWLLRCFPPFIQHNSVMLQVLIEYIWSTGLFDFVGQVSGDQIRVDSLMTDPKGVGHAAHSRVS